MPWLGEGSIDEPLSAHSFLCTWSGYPLEVLRVESGDIAHPLILGCEKEIPWEWKSSMIPNQTGRLLAPTYTI